MNNFIRQCLLAIGLSLTSLALQADDTEIYYSQAAVGDSENKRAANVMVLLDTSGSMRSCEASSGNWCSDVANRRINMLEDAMHLLIDSVPADVNMGLGRFNAGYNCNDGRNTCGAHVLLPVTEINANSKRVFKDTVSALNSAGDSSSGPSTGVPYGSTPTAEAYWEMGRYMMGWAPQNYTSYGNSNNDDNRRDVCLEYEESEECESVDLYGWQNLEAGQTCNTNSSTCRRECTSTFLIFCLEYSYQRYQVIGQDQQCETTTQCVKESSIVDGSGNYISPMNTANECESNHIVLFTDGEANDVNLPCSGGYSSYDCQRAISSYLNRNHDINTYNVGLYMDDNRADMVQVSTKGEEGTYTASDTETLARAFLEIFDQIDKESRSIVAPGVAINQLNRFQHLDQLYYSVFEPTENSYWEGNLKRYKLDDGVIYGQNGAAVDGSTGFFKETSRSYWSDEVDGDKTTAGGARNEVSSRRLFYTTSGGDTRELNWDNIGATKLTKQSLGLDSGVSDGQLQNLLDEMKVMWGDPLHSVPVMVNYGGDSDNNIVFVSNNGGMLHAIDTKNGEEKFAFMPHEFLSRANEYTIERLALKEGKQRQSYGLDGSWIAWRRPGETIDAKPEDVFLYGGMRRGGRDYYALDVGNVNSPSLMWQIKGGVGEFSKLGQSWSTPSLTQIPVGDDTVPVLVFGGGYDPDSHDKQQDKSRGNGDAMGNAIYIVDARSGDLIWSASDTGSNSNNADMKWSIPSSIAVVDKEFDGVADYLYFGDLGGQVFRVDIDQTGGKKMQVHRLATISGSGASGNRRIYEAPSVVYLNDGGVPTLYVAITTGYRSHPLDESIQDGIFVIKDKTALAAPGSAPAYVGLSGMSNVSSGKPDGDDMGWYYFFEKGEKSLASPIVFNNVLRFTTYEPEQKVSDENACSISYGKSYLHTVNIETAEPAAFNNDGTVPDDRREELQQTTPPPSPVLVSDGEGNVYVVVGTEVIGAEDMGYTHLRKRRWYQMDKTQANEFKAVDQ